MDLLDIILTDPGTVNGIYDRYEKYKTESHFFVPVDVLLVDDARLVINVGDKSYKTKDDLCKNLNLWFTSDSDVETFEKLLWDIRNGNIVSMVLMETPETTGAVVLFPIVRGRGKIVILHCDDIQAFSHMEAPRC